MLFSRKKAAGLIKQPAALYLRCHYGHFYFLVAKGFDNKFNIFCKPFVDDRLAPLTIYFKNQFIVLKTNKFQWLYE